MIKSPIKSESKPTAQNIKLCEPGIAQSIDLARISRLNQLYKTEPWHIGLVVHLLADYGLRISEALSIKSTDITSNGQIVIKGSKGSSNRLIVINEYRDRLIDLRSSGFNPIKNIDRFVIYRVLKKWNIEGKFSYGSKNAVCHQFRYNFAKDIQSVTNDLNETARLIGHKSSSNTAIYVNR